MTTIKDFMQDKHRHCDELYATAEEAVAGQDWTGADQAWKLFTGELDTHITGLEEGQLFPALGETLMMLTQQHNMKEENILYPIMDQLLPDQLALLLPGE